jgi:hypothetical protein
MTFGISGWQIGISSSQTEQENKPKQSNDRLTPKETPKILKEKLQEFERQVSAIPEREELRMAQERCPKLLTKGFKLLFLRTEILDPVRAAKRYVKYWQLRVKLFGEERAFLPLMLGGAFSEETDMDLLQCGIVHRLSGRASGTIPVVHVPPSARTK